MTIYVDGSAVVKQIARHEGSDGVGEAWDRAQVVACSAIAYPEARAALAEANRDGQLDGRGLHEAACALERLFADATVVPVDAVTAGGLAEQHGLDAADALHLAAALSLDAPRVVVVTWSPGLASAAADCGMAVVPRLPAPVAAEGRR